MRIEIYYQYINLYEWYIKWVGNKTVPKFICIIITPFPQTRAKVRVTSYLHIVRARDIAINFEFNVVSLCNYSNMQQCLYLSGFFRSAQTLRSRADKVVPCFRSVSI